MTCAAATTSCSVDLEGRSCHADLDCVVSEGERCVAGVCRVGSGGSDADDTADADQTDGDAPADGPGDATDADTAPDEDSGDTHPADAADVDSQEVVDGDADAAPDGDSGDEGETEPDVVGMGVEGDPCEAARDCGPSAPLGATSGRCQDGTLGDGCSVDEDCTGSLDCSAGPAVASDHWRCMQPGFVYIPAGSFVMGAPDGETADPVSGETAAVELSSEEDEYPLHAVDLTRAFALQATEVTRGEWSAVLGLHATWFPACGDECPADQVNWFDALAYLNALSAAHDLPECYDLSQCTGAQASGGSTCTSVTVNAPGGDPYDCIGFRLPTEAEWEYAARAGTSTALYSGGSIVTIASECDTEPALAALAWFCGNALVSYSGCYADLDLLHGTDSSPDCAGPLPVATRTPNGWGLYDMLGNLEEWVWDRYGTYLAESQLDPLGVEAGVARVSRGGSWVELEFNSRSAARTEADPSLVSFSVGFRAARTLPAQSCDDDDDCGGGVCLFGGCSSPEE